jgi:hypothetical protein
MSGMSFFKRLFGRRKPEPQELPPEFLQGNPPDWLIDLKGQLPPDGRRFSILVQLSETARTGTVEILILPRNDADQPKSATVELNRLEIDRLLVILGFSFPADITDVGADPSEGFCADIAVHRREPYMLAAARCNLTGWLDSKKSGPPAIEIGRILVEAQRRTLPIT